MLVRHDGVLVIDGYWGDVSRPMGVGTQTHYVTNEVYAQLSVVVAGRLYTLRAPDSVTRYYRETRGRSPLLGGPAVVMYEVAGMLTADGTDIWLEIDPNGSSQLRMTPRGSNGA